MGILYKSSLLVLIFAICIYQALWIVKLLDSLLAKIYN